MTIIAYILVLIFVAALVLIFEGQFNGNHVYCTDWMLCLVVLLGMERHLRGRKRGRHLDHASPSFTQRTTTKFRGQVDDDINRKNHPKQSADDPKKIGAF